jgi:formate dehydrogenase subunit gamma
MKVQAADRIEDLKERGFANAGLYDPAGVGGTHVMYVLHHADQPSLYHGLPDNPRISPMVGLWKGVAKPLALAGIVLTALAGFFHYTRVGPNEVSKEEEAEALHAARQIKGAKRERSMKHDVDGHPLIERYTPNERSNHWITAITFVLLALSGLAMFHPAMAWMAALFGGGQWTRILHPFFGIVMFVSFFFLVVRFWQPQQVRQGRQAVAAPDRRRAGQPRRKAAPKIGKYNAGQKLLFFVLVLAMVCLLLSGIVIWREYFSHLFPIELRRFSSLLHAFFAFVIIMAIIVHIYAGIWIKGSIKAMTRGTVSYGWARKHHPKWFEALMRKGVDKAGH